MTTPNKPNGRPLGLMTPTHLTASRASLAPPATPSAAYQHQQSLQETFTVLGELTHEFKNHADECALIAKLLSKKKEIAQILSSKQSTMRDLIGELTQQVDDLKSVTSQPFNIGLQQQQQLLQEKKSIVTQQISDMMKEIERLEAAGVEMSKQKSQLQQQKLTCETQKSKSMPSMAGTMGLYRNFSSIAWDYDVDQASCVKGTFHFDRSQTIKRFQFDRREMSDFDIANQLWSMMDTAQ